MKGNTRDYTRDIADLCDMCELVYNYEEAEYENDPRHLELLKKYGEAEKYWDYDFGLQVGIWKSTSSDEKVILKHFCSQQNYFRHSSPFKIESLLTEECGKFYQIVMCFGFYSPNFKNFPPGT